jgi:hypothetical protein
MPGRKTEHHSFFIISYKSGGFTMANNLTYTRCGDYYIPNIKLSYTEPIEWNLFSRMARTYLKEHRPILYNDLILSEQLFPYLKEIGETAAQRMEQLEAELLKANPALDKATQQMAWVQHMNMLRAQAEEIVLNELVYI